jgi:hypothetical protein
MTLFLLTLFFFLELVSMILLSFFVFFSVELGFELRASYLQAGALPLKPK